MQNGWIWEGGGDRVCKSDALMPNVALSICSEHSTEPLMPLNEEGLQFRA